MQTKARTREENGAHQMVTLRPGHYLGERLSSRKLGDVTLTEVAYCPSERLSKHAHARPFFALVLEGGYAERAGANYNECPAGTVLYHPAGTVHCEEFVKTPTRTFNIELHRQWSARFDGCSIQLNEPRCSHRGSLTWILTRLYREFREPDALSALVIDALVIELAVEMIGRDSLRSAGQRPEWLDKVLECLHADARESKTLSHLALAAGVHAAHLARTFRFWMGCTPGEYLRRQRVDYVRRALVSTNLNISQIAAAAGFFDQSHLCRVFKTHEGLSPKRYRELARER